MSVTLCSLILLTVHEERQCDTEQSIWFCTAYSILYLNVYAVCVCVSASVCVGRWLCILSFNLSENPLKLDG